MAKTLTSVYHWVAVNKAGNRIRGETVANNKDEVKTKILALGLTPKTIKKHTPKLKKKKIKTADITVFSRQLATMISAGAPIVQSLEIISASEENQNFKSLVNNMRQTIEDGSTLSDAMKRNPKYFDAYKMSIEDYNSEMIYQDDTGLRISGMSNDENYLAVSNTC